MAGNKDFGKNIKALRDAKGLSQEELAEIIGIEYQSISRIETGMYFTSFENLQKIANALDVSLKDLFDYPESNLSEKELISLSTKKLKKFSRNELEIIYKLMQSIEQCKNT